MKFFKEDGTIIEENDHMGFLLETWNIWFGGKKKKPKQKKERKSIKIKTLNRKLKVADYFIMFVMFLFICALVKYLITGGKI